MNKLEKIEKQLCEIVNEVLEYYNIGDVDSCETVREKWWFLKSNIDYHLDNIREVAFGYKPYDDEPRETIPSWRKNLEEVLQSVLKILDKEPGKLKEKYREAIKEYIEAYLETKEKDPEVRDLVLKMYGYHILIDEEIGFWRDIGYFIQGKHR